jgi:hypothetical protein
MMHSLRRILFIPALPFIWHPERILLVAIFFAMLLVVSVVRSREFKPLTHLLTLLATGLWVAFVFWEIRAKQEGWKIRVDLLFFWSPLIVVSGAAAWMGIRSIVMGKSNDQTADKTPVNPSLCADPQR